MAAGNDRLSGLGDDLLRRVLHFVPAREGALTSALSRRWRPLWRSCGAVNLVARAHEDSSWRHHPLWRSSLALRDAFVSAAHQALDSADQAAKADGHPPIRKLTIRVEAIRSDNILRFLHGDMDYHKEHDVLGSLLAHKASRRVEELRIAAVDSVDGKPMYFERSKYEAAANIHGLGIYPLGLGSLPSGTLRVLELTNCSSLKPAAAGTSFPRLTSLRLRHCNAPFKELQRIIDAAPLLAVIHLEAILLDEDARPGFKVDTPPPVEGTLRSLRCLAATVLVLDKCCLNKNGTVEIDAPMLRHFRYKGAVRHISLDPPPQQLARAELTIIDHGGRRNSDPCRSFWGTVRGLSHAKEMKLRVRHVEEIRCHYTNEAKNIKLRRLERLELQGVYTPTENAAAQLIKNLLRCSPALSELRIELSTTAHDESTKRSYGGVQIVDSKHRAQVEESVRRFKSRRQGSMVAGGEDDGVDYDQVSDVPGLTGHSFKCLRSCLIKVGLKFRREMTNCFGAQLIKFFAQNAMALETMFIDAGNERIHEHVNLKIEKWIANSSKGRRMNATKVQVLPLTR